MLPFEDHILIKVAVLATIIIVALSQQTNAATPSTQLLKKAQALLEQNQASAALACLNTLISKEPNNALAYIQLGHIYIHLGKFQNALKDCAVAIKISPQSYKAYCCRAEAYEGLGEYQKQIDDLASAVTIDPNDGHLYARRAHAYYQLGQLQNAIDDCTTATSLNSALSEAYRTAAKAYEELGLYDKAIELRTKLLGLEIQNAFEWSYRAIDYEMLGKFDLAQADRQKAIKLASPGELAEMQLGSPLIDFNHSSSERPTDKIDRQLKDGSVVLSLHYDNGGHICVPVQVNGHPLQFMLDTGSAHSDLWKQAMPGMAKMDKVQVQGTNANGKEHLCGWFRARDLKLGNLTLPNVAMEADEGLIGHKTLSGFLGGNVLENFVVTIDYSRKQVILSNSFEKNSSKKAIIVPMRIRNHLPHCSVKLDGRLEVMALLDTGCPDNMSADSLLKPVLEKKLAFYERTSGPWLGNLSVGSIRLKSVQLGDSNFEAPIFVVFPAAEAPAAAKSITLGNSFLSRFKTVTFDYRGRQIIFEPNDTVSKSAPDLYSEGQFYFQHDDMRQAIDAFSKSMILDKEFAPACYVSRATVFMNLKQYRKALEDMTAAIMLDPKDAQNYGTRAWIYEDLGQYRLQVADDTTAIRLDPNFQFAYLNRAWAYDRLGKHQLAKRDRRTAKKVCRRFR